MTVKDKGGLVAYSRRTLDRAVIRRTARRAVTGDSWVGKKKALLLRD